LGDEAIPTLSGSQQQDYTTTHYCQHAGPDRDVDQRSGYKEERKIEIQSSPRQCARQAQLPYYFKKLRTSGVLVKAWLRYAPPGSLA